MKRHIFRLEVQQKVEGTARNSSMSSLKSRGERYLGSSYPKMVERITGESLKPLSFTADEHGIQKRRRKPKVVSCKQREYKRPIGAWYPDLTVAYPSPSDEVLISSI
jgi:hypothetical protein